MVMNLRYCLVVAIAAALAACGSQQPPPPRAESAAACDINSKLVCERMIANTDAPAQLAQKDPLLTRLGKDRPPTMSRTVNLGVGDPQIEVLCEINAEHAVVVHSRVIDKGPLSETDVARLRVEGLCK